MSDGQRLTPERNCGMEVTLGVLSPPPIPSEISAESALRLFQAVVTQALIDACSKPEKVSQAKPKRRGKSKKHEAETDFEYADRCRRVIAKRVVSEARIRNEARTWLTGNGYAFRHICDLAGYNPDDIRERAIILASRGWPQPSVKSDIAA